MKEHPILFSGEMVKAILEGRKTQTRRIIRSQPKMVYLQIGDDKYYDAQRGGNRIKCKYQVGDRLWVREGYDISYANISGICGISRIISGVYKADLAGLGAQLTEDEWAKFLQRKRKFGNQTGRFMYKSLARIWLEITNVRVERVQDISTRDCWAEGLRFGTGATYQGIVQMRNLWDSLNAKRGFSWETNPWVWVIEFKIKS